MKNILAENMLRFGVKNLSESDIKPYILEQTKVPQSVYRGKYVAQLNIDQLAKFIPTYNPTTGPIAIKNGNPWLATQRAKSLQRFLIERFRGQFNIPFDESSAKIIQTAVPGPGDENQYMKATIKAKLKTSLKPAPTYPYSILYNFYDINGVPHIIVTKQGLLGQSSPKLSSRGAVDQSAINQFSKFIQSTKNSKLVKQSFSGRPDGDRKSVV